MLRFKFFLLLLITALVATALALSVLLQTFDLTRYRETLQEQLSASLSQPVSLGQIHFSLRQGLSLEIDQLHIGSPAPEASTLQVERLFLKLSLWELLFKRIQIQAITLDAPHLKLGLSTAAEASASPAPTLVDASFLKNINVGLFRIRNGSIAFSDHRRPETPFEITATNLQGSLFDISTQGISHFEFSGNLAGAGTESPFSLDGEFHPPPDFLNWRRTGGTLNLRVDGLDPRLLVRRYGPQGSSMQTRGLVSGNLHLSASPASGTQLELQLQGHKLSLLLPQKYQSPLALGEMGISGLWTFTLEQGAVDDLKVKLNGITLSGNLSLQHRSEGIWIEGRLATPAISLEEVLAWIPDRNAPALAEARPQIKGGTLRLEEMQLGGLLRELHSTGEQHPVRSARLRVQGLNLLRFPQAPIKAIAANLSWEPSTLSLSEGRALLDEAPFAFSGALTIKEAAPPELNLSIEGVVAQGLLRRLVQDQLKNAFDLQGNLPLKASVKGTPKDLFVDAKAELLGLGISKAEVFTKPPEMEGTLFLTGRVRPEGVELEHSRLLLPALELRANGTWAGAAEHPFAMSLDLNADNLEKLTELAPQLGRISPSGKLALHYDFKGDHQKLDTTGGMVSLRGFGMSLGTLLAPLSQTTGQIRIEGGNATFSEISANLGSSPVTLSGALRGGDSPELELLVKAPSIRANELIFPSDEAMLRNVDGRLLIGKDKIEYAPVRVRLDGGTEALVRGRTEDFKSPLTTLEIEAGYGNIDEVIALWHRPEKTTATETPHPDGRSNPLSIEIRAQKGQLHRLHFEEASGHLALIEGDLVIKPLEFKTAGGQCSGEVRLHKRPQAPSLLQIAARVQGVNAEELYRSQLLTRGLTSGTLKSEFQLSGEPGAGFIPSSQGQFSLAITEGVLYKFEFLAKVFSILNVSQILSLKLPEMDSEGMPFKSLSATGSLKNGVLSTEDLFIKSQSMNLTLVGKLDLKDQQMDMVLGAQPLRTVDKVVTHIPIAGWILGGKEKALITTQFEIRGKATDPEVTAIPFNSLSKKVIGIFKRLLRLPEKVITDPAEVFQMK